MYKPFVINVPTAQYNSPADFTATYTTRNTLTLSLLPATLTITNVAQIVFVKVIRAGGQDGVFYINGSGSCAMEYAVGILTVNGVENPFADGDAFSVGIMGQSITSDLNIDTQSVNTSGMIGKPVGGDGDFTTAWASATTITCANFPVWYANLTADDLETIRQIDTAGTVVNTYSRDDATMSVGANVITVVGATFVNTDTFVIFTNVDQTNYHLQEIEAALENGGAIPVSTHRSPVDFTAAFTSNVTITLVGLPFAIVDNSQLVYIKQVTAANTSKTWINGKNCTLTEAGGVITIHGGGTPFVVADDYEVGINSQDKAYDSTQSADKILEQAPVWDHFVVVPHVTVAHEITNAYTDLGGEIDMRTYNQLGLFITVDIGTSTNVRIRILHKHTSAGAEEYREIYLGGPVANITTINLNDYEVNTDVDQLFKINLPTSNTSPYIQLQVKDDADGDGQIDAITYVKSWSV